MEATSMESAVEALMAPVEPETAEVTEAPAVDETVEEEVAEAEQAEVDVEDSEEYDEDESEEYDESEEQEADQAGPEMYTIKVDGADVEVTLDDLKRDYSGQTYIQKGMKQAAEQRKQAEQIYNDLNQQREQFGQFMQQVQQQGVIPAPTPPSRDLLSDDPLGYMEADAQYREDVQKFNAQQQQITHHKQQLARSQAQAQQVHLQEQMDVLKQAIPDFGDADKAPKLKESLVKQGVSLGYSPDEIGGITDSRAMIALHKAMMYDQLMAGKTKVDAKVKKAKPLIKSGAKKPVNSAAKRHKQQMSKFKKSGSIADAAALLMNS